MLVHAPQILRRRDKSTVFVKYACSSIMVILSDVRIAKGAFQANSI